MNNRILQYRLLAPLSLGVVIVLMVLLSPRAQSASSASADPFPPTPGYVADQCRDALELKIQDEIDTYRRVQYGQDYISVLGTDKVATTQLVPYLTLNYHGLSCRLLSLCKAVELSYNPSGTGTVLPTRPIGCSRVYANRGRWWEDDRREFGFNNTTIKECSYYKYKDLAFTSGEMHYHELCQEWVEQIIAEEAEMLKLFVTQDSVHRGTKQVAGAFQVALDNIREGFLHPLRGLVDLFGSIIHPIPCLLTQCN